VRRVWDVRHPLLVLQALVQYFRPFLSTDLTKMAESFETDVPALIEELSALIIEGKIDARIDSHNRVRKAQHNTARCLSKAI
jgi:COP9 signalosome complex subunit 1